MTPQAFVSTLKNILATYITFLHKIRINAAYDKIIKEKLMVYLL